jgi:large subunit ribosomal protein L5
MARLLEQYRKEIVPKLQKEFGLANAWAVPHLEKICLNMGLGQAIDESKLLDNAVKCMTNIAGQAAAVTTARISVSNFRLRKGMRIGCRATLRGARMYEFLDRFVNVAVPGIRDFRGLNPKSFDKAGNYTLGIEEITVFPEIDPDQISQPLGMDVTMVIKNSTGPEQSRHMLKLMGMPFREE